MGKKWTADLRMLFVKTFPIRSLIMASLSMSTSADPQIRSPVFTIALDFWISADTYLFRINYV